MMEAVRTSETSVDNHFTRQYIPEDNSEHHTRRRENLKSHVTHYVAPHAVILSSPSFLSFFYTKVTVALVMEAESTSCHFILLQLNIVFRILFSNTLRPGLLPYKTTDSIMVFIYFNLYVLRQQAGRQNTLNVVVAGIPQI
jgi:hypothetical protein